MNNSPEFRRECEARQVLKWPKEKRMPFCDSLRAIRSDKAADELIAEVKRQHKLIQAQQQGMEI